ncbi:hypothetical protein [Weissella kandleri]|uniref:hypothetical protein n=1 Tax=Weissella kandleri TaxID=1616 RepID=UPI00070F146D|nr:hypothetical protein [Weissella kandleri]
MKASTARKLEARGYDLEFLRDIENGKPVIFHSDFVQYGDGYMTILSVYDYPKTQQGQGWFRNLFSQSNTISILKIGTEDRAKVEHSLKTAAANAQGIVNAKWQDDSKKLAASQEYQSNMDDLNAVINANATFKRVYTRIMVMDRTLPELKKRVAEMQRKLSTFDIRIYSGEMAMQFSQIFTPAMQIEKEGNRDKGFPMNAYALAGTFPFNYSYLNDPRGTYMGLSLQQGEMIFDPSYNDGRHRLVAYMLVVGNVRMGKSSWAKKNIRPLWARGDKMWIFDKSFEYEKLVESMYGIHLTMDGSQNNVNLLQVFATVLTPEGDIDEIQSFRTHIEKIKTVYSTLNPEAGTHELNTLTNELTEFYIQSRMWSYSPDEHPEEIKVVNLPDENYPILEDFVNYLHSKLINAANMRPNEVERLENIHSVFDSLISDYGEMFNTVTNVPDLQQEQVVRFDTSGIANLDKKVYNAQYFNILSLMNAYVTINGYQQRQRLENHEFTQESVKTGRGPMPTYFWWIQDEADDIFNAGHPLGITFANRMMSQQGKNFFGMMAIFPGLENVIPDGVQKDTEESRATRNFFGQFQTYAILNLPKAQTNKLRKVLPSSEVTDSQLNTINGLERGGLLLSIKGAQSTFMNMALSDEEKDLFRGGM